MSRSFFVDAIEQILGPDVLGIEGDRARAFVRPLPIGAATPDSLAFAKKDHPAALELVTASAAAVVLCGPELRDRAGGHALRVYVENPRLAFARVVRTLFVTRRPAGVHPSAVVDAEAEIDPSAHVGPHVFVGKAVVGPRSELWPNVTVLDGVRIGADVIVRSGCVLGTDGFGYEQAPDGSWEHLPHLGGVVIEDGVELGAGVAIARGTMGDTVLHRGVKVDNHVHIAHNVEIGADTLVIATAHISGSARIGERSWIAPGAAISDGVTVGSDTTVGLNAAVLRDVPDRAKVMGPVATALPERFWNPAFVKR